MTDEVLRLDTEIAVSNIFDVIDISASGEISLKPLDELPAQVRRGIKRYEAGPDSRFTIEMHDKGAALERLGRHHGLYSRT